MAVDACGICGVEAALGARYCHECGARLDAFVVEPPTDPETAGAEQPAAGSASRALVGLGLAVAAVVLGLVLFSGSPDDNTVAPAEVEPPAPSAPGPQISSAELASEAVAMPWGWPVAAPESEAVVMPWGWPVAAVDREGLIMPWGWPVAEVEGVVVPWGWPAAELDGEGAATP